MKWGPTSANSSPARLIFVRSAAAKDKLLACVSPGNVAKVREAPVTVIIGMDMAFHEQLPKLFPHADARSWFAGNADKIAETAFRNSSLQGAYLIIAARALGLDCGPMSGFDAARMDAAFWAGSTVKTNFICALGHGDPASCSRAARAWASTTPAGLPELDARLAGRMAVHQRSALLRRGGAGGAADGPGQERFPQRLWRTGHAAAGVDGAGAAGGGDHAAAVAGDGRGGPEAALARTRPRAAALDDAGRAGGHRGRHAALRCAFGQDGGRPGGCADLAVPGAAPALSAHRRRAGAAALGRLLVWPRPRASPASWCMPAARR